MEWGGVLLGLMEEVGVVFAGAKLREECLHLKSRKFEVLVLSQVLLAEAAAEPVEVSVPSAPSPGVSRFLHVVSEPVYVCSGIHQ